MTSEHDSVSAAVTSLRETGEVRRASARRSPRAITDARKIPAGMVDESMSGKENACECRRSLRVGRPQGCRGEVRVAIVAWKRGNARGAKGGRKAEAVEGDELRSSLGRRYMPLKMGKPLTGEPCAGDPHARFGGRGGANQCAIPTSILRDRRAPPQSVLRAADGETHGAPAIGSLEGRPKVTATPAGRVVRRSWRVRARGPWRRGGIAGGSTPGRGRVFRPWRG
jgi:hypothetical protein